MKKTISVIFIVAIMLFSGFLLSCVAPHKETNEIVEIAQNSEIEIKHVDAEQSINIIVDEILYSDLPTKESEYIEIYNIDYSNGGILYNADKICIELDYDGNYYIYLTLEEYERSNNVNYISNRYIFTNSKYKLEIYAPISKDKDLFIEEEHRHTYLYKL